MPPIHETGHLPAYTDGDDHDATDEDSEAVETGLRDSRESAARAVASRIGRRPRDMIISVVVLLLVVFALFGLYRFLGGDTPARVDPGPIFQEAQVAAAFTVLRPTGLSDDWRPVSAAYQPQSSGAVLRVGWRTPDDGTMQLIESNLPADSLLPKELGGNARETAKVDIAGKQWQAYDARDDERVLVLDEPGRIVIVIGRTSDAELRAFAESLR